jgi:hypothetical protein
MTTTLTTMILTQTQFRSTQATYSCCIRRWFSTSVATATNFVVIAIILTANNQNTVSMAWLQTRQSWMTARSTGQRLALSPLSSFVNFETDSTKPFTNSSSTSLLHSSVFGDLCRIRLAGEEDDKEENKSFLGAMEVPTFASTGDQETNIVEASFDTKARGLEGVLNHGPAFLVDRVLSRHACEQIISDCELLNFGNFNCGRNHHGAMQIMVKAELADAVAQKLAPHINVNEVEELRREMIRATTRGADVNDIANQQEDEDVRLFFVGLNRRWRIYRYDSSGNETFAPHIDAGFPPSGLSKDGKSLVWDDSPEYHKQEIVSRLTVLMYLNDDFEGGETNFYRPSLLQKDTQLGPLIASVRPVTGSVLLFPQGVGEGGVDHARKCW